MPKLNERKTSTIKIANNDLVSNSGAICVCPKCGTRVEKEARVPCHEMLCPNCQERMIRP